MKLIFTATMRGTESACVENLEYMLSVDPLILDEFSLDIKTFSEEELEK